jgi:hypothetical protein
MAYVVKLLILNLVTMLALPTLSVAQVRNSKLPVLKTKQTLNTLRFVSNDGKFNYYQRRGGSLLLSLNYKVVEVLQGGPGTQYTLYSTAQRKKILIKENPTYHDYLSLRQSQRLYWLNYGGDTPNLIGDGIYPSLHLDDEWVSYFNAHTRHLHIQNLSNSALKFTIKLNNSRDPYFVPSVIMLDEFRVLYTDLNQAGLTGVLLFNRRDGSAELFSKAERADQKIEICKNDQDLYVLETGVGDSSNGTKIYQLKLENLDQKSAVEVYRSEFNDIGQIDCSINNDTIYFVKNTSTTNSAPTYEAAKLKISDKKVEILSDLNYVTQILNLDGRLLIPYRNQYYVLLGDNDLTLEDSLTPTSSSDDNAESQGAAP